jgi:hypothetical protein
VYGIFGNKVKVKLPVIHCNECCFCKDSCYTAITLVVLTSHVPIDYTSGIEYIDKNNISKELTKTNKIK